MGLSALGYYNCAYNMSPEDALGNSFRVSAIDVSMMILRVVSGGYWDGSARLLPL